MVTSRSRDRLAELRQLASGAGAGRGGELDVPPDVPPDAPPDGKWQGLDELLLEVERARGWLRDLSLATQLLRRLHADPTYHTSRQLQEQLDAAATRAAAAALKAGGALRQLGERARAAGAAGGGGGARTRIARLQSAALARQYADALGEHQRALLLLRDDHLRLLRHQMRLTNVTLSEEECERLLDSNSVALFVDNVRAETAEARRALREADARREELARVEAALRDLHDLYQQLAHLVAAQQEQIDSVEYFALQATEHVESGGHQLLRGSVRRRAARRKKLGLAACLACGLALVLLVLVAT